MLNVDLIVLGNLKERYLVDGCTEYIKRLNRYCKLKVIEINEVSIKEAASPKEIQDCLDKEAELIIKKLNNSSKKIVMCIEGIQKTSEKFADLFMDYSINGTSNIQFIIGSSYGLSNKIKQLADYKMSISKMTFPHQLLRFILLEQIYRAFSINNNSKYHK